MGRRSIFRIGGSERMLSSWSLTTRWSLSGMRVWNRGLLERFGPGFRLVLHRLLGFRSLGSGTFGLQLSLWWIRIFNLNIARRLIISDLRFLKEHSTRIGWSAEEAGKLATICRLIPVSEISWFDDSWNLSNLISKIQLLVEIEVELWLSFWGAP